MNSLKYLLYFVICGSLIVSCSSDRAKTDSVFGIVKEWQGKEIVFPEVMTDVLTGDTLDLGNNEFTVITYIDSVGCTSCTMKLPLWNYFLNSLDSVCGGRNYEAIFIVNIKDKEELSFMLKREKYHYPVVCDSLDFLNRTNKLPQNQMFRTFLLDRNNHVMTIGSPIYSARIADLYRAIITGSKTFSASGKRVISVDKPRIDLGNIQLGRRYTSMVTLMNEGSDDVKIREIISSCPCTEVEVADSIVPRNGKLKVLITFHEDSETGDFERNIHIFYHDVDNPTAIEISGTI